MRAIPSILYVQYGDFAEAYERFERGGEETFRDQKLSVLHTIKLAEKARVTVLSISGSSERTLLGPNLTAIKSAGHKIPKTLAINLLKEFQVTHLILCSPIRSFLVAARVTGAALLPLFADHFGKGGLRQRLRHRRLSHVLRSSPARCYCNHNLNASRSMRDELGLPSDMIIPWDHVPVPTSEAPKSNVAGTPVRICYAGTLSEAKGVGDLLDAIALLKDHEVRLNLFGGGDVQRWRQAASERGLSGRVTFLGSRPNREVRAAMAAHDLVVVPSRHNYAEGLPNVLLEGLSSGTPVVVSDHPAYADRLSDGGCEIFRAAQPADLARAIDRLMTDPSRYAAISKAGIRKAQELEFGIERLTLIDRFLDDPENTTDWVKSCSLGAYETKQATTTTRGRGNHG
ncbi:glycosyltransferase family 4 protein [Paracoccus sp. TK19116]|uniref:Glycosyltransferase family 4 protein n=1 Tax=Paracoccus albicereus TaxID=2922394 RepID=A0ABT1MS78_9RHOB|nr:glycosyltransferase family 4 protein [Paracoccus albicereus]MCQ0969736.1 glycosyltransferase family 4 protein [Paracoccus albicereus]